MSKKKPQKKSGKATYIPYNNFLKNFKWVKKYKLTKILITLLVILAPISAIFCSSLWFYNTYYFTPWEFYKLIFQRSTFNGLEILPGYLEIKDLPGYLEERKTNIEIINDLMNEHDFNMYDLIDLANCESTLNHEAYNKSSGATGLFQFKPSTWNTTPYCNEDIWDPEYQTLATIWMFEHNRYREWECFRYRKLKERGKYQIEYHGCGLSVN